MRAEWRRWLAALFWLLLLLLAVYRFEWLEGFLKQVFGGKEIFRQRATLADYML